MGLIFWSFINILAPVFSLNAQASCTSSYLDRYLVMSNEHAESSSREILDKFIEQHPELNELGFKDMLNWLDKNDGAENFIFKMHIEDWLHEIGIKDTKEIDNLKNLWPMLSTEQKKNSILKLKKQINISNLSSLFDDPEKWATDFKFIEKKELTLKQVQEFNSYWKNLSSQEQELFLFSVLEEDLPHVLDYFLPKPIREQAMILADTSKMVEVKIVTGVFKRKILHLNESLLRAFTYEKEDSIAGWFDKVNRLIKNRSSFRFDEIEYFISQVPKKSETWVEIDHAFKYFSIEEVKMNGFAHYKNIDGTNIGRLGGSASYVLNMLEKLDTLPNKEQLKILKAFITNGREQEEMYFRLNQRFPGFSE